VGISCLTICHEWTYSLFCRFSDEEQGICSESASLQCRSLLEDSALQNFELQTDPPVENSNELQHLRQISY
jgi:hypothetical protein